MRLDLSSIRQYSQQRRLAASLVYLGVQAHQNAKHTPVLIQSAWVDRLMSQMIGFSDAENCAA